MGTGNLTVRNDGDVIPVTDHNELVDAMEVDLIPRNSSGIPTANGGKMGTPTYPWIRATITTGYLFCGQVILFHDFNGAISPGHGWMKCNGDVIGSTAYEAVHGVGTWATYIVSSPISGKNLPNMAGRYPVGKATTPQDGTVAITSVGVTGSTLNLAHTHIGPTHTHTWYVMNGNTSTDNSYDANGNQNLVKTPATGSGGGAFALQSTLKTGFFLLDNSGNFSFHTSHSDQPSNTTDSQLTSPQDIRPESIEFQYWMRII